MQVTGQERAENEDEITAPQEATFQPGEAEGGNHKYGTVSPSQLEKYLDKKPLHNKKKREEAATAHLSAASEVAMVSSVPARQTPSIARRR